MTMSGAAAGLLLAAGLALGVLLAALAPVAAARRRARSRPATPPPAGFPDDDLPDFLATPPGSASARAMPRSGWAALSALPPPQSAAAPAGVPPGRVAVISGLTALVLMAGFLAVVATTDGRQAAAPEHRVTARASVPLPAVPTAPAPGDPGAGRLAAVDVPVGRRGATADLTFTGIVLERRAVGVSAAYPHVRVTDDGSTALAHLELVTFNCLTDTAPPDPVAAGCLRVVPEYAELVAPALQVIRTRGGGLVLRGRFPTYLRPNGTPAAWTGEVYDLRVEVSPTTVEQPGTDVPATGFLQLGADRAGTTSLSVVRSGR